MGQIEQTTTTTPGQSGTKINGNEGILITQISRTGA